jgi:hypothetical protein
LPKSRCQPDQKVRKPDLEIGVNVCVFAQGVDEIDHQVMACGHYFRR